VGALEEEAQAHASSHGRATGPRRQLGRNRAAAARHPPQPNAGRGSRMVWSLALFFIGSTVSTAALSAVLRPCLADCRAIDSVGWLWQRWLCLGVSVLR
jgi:hypothetical protein